MAERVRKLHRTATTIETKTAVPVSILMTCHRTTRTASGISGSPMVRTRSCLSLPIRLMIRANRMAKQAEDVYKRQPHTPAAGGVPLKLPPQLSSFICRVTKANRPYSMLFLFCDSVKIHIRKDAAP